VAETLKETPVKENDQDSEENINTDEETTKHIGENEQKEEQSLESRQTEENPELDKIKIEFHKALKEFEGTDPAIRLQIPKQKCSRKLATIITAINQEILPEYTKNVTNFPELHNTIYAAAVATMRMSRGKIKNNSDYSQNKKQIPPWESRLKKQISDLRKDTGRVQQVQRGNTSNRIQKHMRRIGEKYTHMPNTAQVMSTPRKYLTPSSKSYQQSHKGLDGIRKQMNESNKTDYLLPTKRPTTVT
jgi:hypothetical protein